MNNYLLYSSIATTKGASRSILQDLQREKIEFIPNTLFDILQSEILNIEILKKAFAKNIDEENIIEEYFEFLIENEYIFKVSDTLKNSFPKLSKSFEYPFEISNAIVDLDSTITDVDLILFKLSNACIYNIQIRVFNSLIQNEFLLLLIKLKALNFRSVSIICQYNESLKYNFIEGELTKYKFLHSVIIHSYSDIEIDLYNDNSTKIVYSNQKVQTVSNCGCIAPQYFSLNDKHYYESQSFNTCLNKKLSIDINGNIKNCPSLKENYGNIKDKSLEDVFNTQDFKRYWNLKKDDIAVCRDCEFRHICTDCRAYLEDPEDIYSKPLKCGYNPYNCEWEEWSSNPIKQKAIDYYHLREIIQI